MATLAYDSRNSASLTADNRSTAGSLSIDLISGISYLLLENGSFLLVEIGDKIILESISGLTLDIRN